MNLKYLIAGTGRCGSVYVAKLLTSVGISCSHENLFNVYGLEITTERMFQDIIVQSDVFEKDLPSSYCGGQDFDITNYVAESSYFAVPFLDHSLLQETQIIHLIRHPLKVISSFVYDFNFFKKDKNEDYLFLHKPFYIENYHDTLKRLPPPPNEMEAWIYHFYPEITIYKTALDRAAKYYLQCNELIEQHKVFTYKIEDSPENLLDFFGISKTDVMYKNKKSNSRNKRKQHDISVDSFSPDLKDELLEFMKQYEYEETNIKSVVKRFI